MPNFDGGHYFLTALIPVRQDLCADPRTDATVTSHLHELRAALAALPTALQTPATEAIGLNSPFARSDRTHFARFAVLDDVAFNGRGQRDPIAVSLRLAKPPSEADPVDRLPCSFLILVVDFDAPDGSDAALDDYLAHLWAVMAPELQEILQHCEGHARLVDAAGFAGLVRACQVETTMPFNDYWTGAPPLAPLPLKRLLAPAALGALALGIGLLGALVAALTPWHAKPWLLLALAGLVVLPLGLWWAYAAVMAAAAKPFPTAPRSDLPSVLKALYLQQRFTRFAIDTQGATPEALHAAFGDFLAAHRPEDVAAPTQRRGVVKC
ncbi:hypothetical protein [Falsiroseomonas selenitidurans]|uniref:Uncharacterized protein n=1 Tax=Falsiroseomonas selenitidurans TaxID=2716335 RepID=A0ABX1E7Z1_9PROT|nr:hypothetical protein [Falsiroseomonas selenitidurans]NKC32865.1 hypothetical protein [Falsiroseomonas selenitidurans]